MESQKTKPKSGQKHAPKALKDIPGYQRAIDRARVLEHWIRLAPFLPQERRIASIPIVALTLRRYLLLQVVRSPLLLDGAFAGGADLTQALWILSPDLVAVDSERRISRRAARDARVRWLAKYGPRLVRRLKHPNGLASVAKKIRAEIGEALYDCAVSLRDGSAPTVSVAAAILDEFIGAYDWSEEQILDTPLAKLIQFRRARAGRIYPAHPQHNPSDFAGDQFAKAYLRKRSRPSTK